MVDRGRTRDRPPPPGHPSADRSPFFHPSKPSSRKKAAVEVVTTPGGSRKVVRKEPPRKDAEPEAKSSILGTTANNISVIVGSGIVGMPYALRESGFLAGMFMLIGVAFLTEKSLRLMVDTGKYLNVPSYETLMEACFGYAGFVFISINMFITSYGGCMSYLIIIKDTIPSLLGVENDNIPMRSAILTVSSLLIILPLSMQRDMANLAKTSAISVFNDIVVVCIVAFFAPVREGVEAAGGWMHILTHDTWEPSTIFVGLGVVSFAFVCQDSAFLIAGSLERPTRERWASVTRLSLLTCGVLAILCGLSGYLAFQRDTEGNILNNFVQPETQGAASAARALLGITMFFVYPLSSYVCRHVIIVLLFRGRTAHEGDDHSVLARKDRRIFTTVLVYLIALIPALLFDDLGIVLGLAGAVGASCIAYIGPGVTYLAAHGGEFLEAVEVAWDLLAGGGRGRLGSSVTQLWKHPRQVSVRSYHRQAQDTAGKPWSHGSEAQAENVPLTLSRIKPMEQEQDTNTGGTEDGIDSCSLPRRVLVVAAWYVLLMPLWCGVAAVGGRRVRAYEEEQALKSPRPSRLGRIVHERFDGDHNDKTDNSSTTDAHAGTMMVKSASVGDGSSPKKFICPDDYGATAGTSALGDGTAYSGNKAISKAIAKSMKRKTSSINGDSEGNDEELQEAEVTPNCFDFLIAICYIFLGLVAVMAGIVSISMGG